MKKWWKETSAVVKENLTTEKAEKQSTKIYLPKTWEELEVYTSRLKDDDFIKRYEELNAIAVYINTWHSPTDYILRHLIFMKLLLLRDIYNYLDDSPKINNNHIISIEYNHLTKKIEKIEDVNNLSEIFDTRPVVLGFYSRDYRDLFFENFKDMIEECKEYI